ncbi:MULTISPECIES: NADH-quinone oxidoreductase subunit C [unclassified Streptomyces]|uniref:NADH-quinone oxidoreductase subunit C n=1 Tax=unclassified Streptomyces TaxID=2593676 RepID=UPI0033ABFCBE
MSAYDILPESVTEVFGEEATAERAYDLLTVDVPPASWIAALTTARDTLGCTYFDWLSAVDEPGTGFRVCAHVVSLAEGSPRRLLVRTTVPHAAPVLPTAVEVYAGAGWHERETHEMFGVDFTGHPNLVPLLLPENFEGHPLRKDFVLAARVAKAWPGAKEPGESHDGGPKRRQMLPPGVPDPNEWGPLKGQLPPAPTRAERPARRTRTTTDDPTATAPRRTRSVSEGSASQDATAEGSASQDAAPAPARRARSVSEGSAGQDPTAAPARRSRSAADGSASQAAGEPGTPARRSRSASDGSVSRTPAGDAAGETPPEAPRPPRRSRSASDGSASQAVGEPGAPVRRSRSASDGSASQSTAPDATEGTPPEAARPPRRSRSAADGSVSQTPPEPRTPRAHRSSDAPWHHARPAFDEEPAALAEQDTAPAPQEAPAPPAEPDTATEPAAPAEPGTDAEPGKEKPTDPDPADPTHPAGGDPA